MKTVVVSLLKQHELQADVSENGSEDLPLDHKSQMILGRDATSCALTKLPHEYHDIGIQKKMLPCWVATRILHTSYRFSTLSCTLHVSGDNESQVRHDVYDFVLRPGQLSWYFAVVHDAWCYYHSGCKCHICRAFWSGSWEINQVPQILHNWNVNEKKVIQHCGTEAGYS